MDVTISFSVTVTVTAAGVTAAFVISTRFAVGTMGPNGLLPPRIAVKGGRGFTIGPFSSAPESLVGEGSGMDVDVDVVRVGGRRGEPADEVEVAVAEVVVNVELSEVDVELSAMEVELSELVGITVTVAVTVCGGTMGLDRVNVLKVVGT